MKVRLYPLSNSGYTSQLHAGLFDLANEGAIELRITDSPKVRVSERDWGRSDNARLGYVELEPGDGRCLILCYDMIDGPEIISLDGLNACDVYFKRSFDRQFLETAPDEWHDSGRDLLSKVLPYGLNCQTGSRFEFDRAESERIVQTASGDVDRRRRGFDEARRNPARWLKETLRSLRRRPKFRPMYEIEPTQPAEKMVLFQTRLFNSHSNVHFSAEVEDINERRIKVLRAVKRAVGKRFVGGFIPNDISKRQCPDLITTNQYSRDAYFRIVRQCEVVLFTRGRRESTGWRFPEFLAASRAIVSEPLVYEVPTPLVDGQHMLVFEDADTAVAACERLLSDAEFTTEMRARNWEYYQRYVKPASLVRNSLEAACAHAT